MAARGRGKGRGGISYVQNEEPTFISEFKKKIGYKEGPTVDTKRQQLDVDSDDEEGLEKEDEKPIVVVLKSGDLTESEADHEKAAQELKPTSVDDIEASSGKVRFKKPTKRPAETDPEEQEGSSKKKEAKKEEKLKSSTKQVKNSKLLSFGDEDEEDEDEEDEDEEDEDEEDKDEEDEDEEDEDN